MIHLLVTEHHTGTKQANRALKRRKTVIGGIQPGESVLQVAVLSMAQRAARAHSFCRSVMFLRKLPSFYGWCLNPLQVLFLIVVKGSQTAGHLH